MTRGAVSIEHRGRPARRGVVLAAGLTPCASAVIILLFALANGVLAIGIAATLVMALGVSVTVSLVGLATIAARRTLLGVMAARPRAALWLRRGLTLTGALRAAAVGALLASLVACATAPAIPFAEPRELAGAWRGRMTGRSGSATASLTIKADGSFTGTMYLDGEDQDFSGAITMVRPGQALYRSTQGLGKVVLAEQGGTRTLRLQPEGGGVASLFTPVP